MSIEIYNFNIFRVKFHELFNYLVSVVSGRTQEININSQESAGKRRAKRCLKVNNTAFGHRFTGASPYFLAYKAT